MKCRNCEADLPDNAESCPWCGIEKPFTENIQPDLDEPATILKESEPVEENIPQKISSTSDLPDPIPPTPNASKNWLLWVVIAIVLVLVLCCVCWFGTGFLSVLGGGTSY